MKDGIAFIFDDETVLFVSSYSYNGGYVPHYNKPVDPFQIILNLTDDLDDTCNWREPYQIDAAYRNLKTFKQTDKNIVAIIKINSDVFKRYIKIKKLKEKCQITGKTNL